MGVGGLLPVCAAVLAVLDLMCEWRGGREEGEKTGGKGEGEREGEGEGCGWKESV